jgi:uncharacterized protein YkwD
VVLLAAAMITASAHARAPASRATCAGARRAARRLSLQAVRAAVVCLINRERRERGLPPLTASPSLNKSAQDWTVRMVWTGDFSHGSNPFARMSAAGYDWKTAGENIATGQPTPETVVSAWMASLAHCRMILDPAFRNVGTGETPAPVSGASSGPATWTEDFGLPAGARWPSHDSIPAKRCPY